MSKIKSLIVLLRAVLGGRERSGEGERKREQKEIALGENKHLLTRETFYSLNTDELLGFTVNGRKYSQDYLKTLASGSIVTAQFSDCKLASLEMSVQRARTGQKTCASQGP